ncbi:hypothetical protein ACVR1G_05330 [Streptococcus dentasini]
MVMTDEQIQGVQDKTRPLLESDNPKQQAIVNGEQPLEIDGQHYMVVNHTNNEDINGQPNDNTQALAVAPCDKNGHNIDYDNVTITVGGTQPSNPSSLGNALFHSRFELTQQTEAVDNFTSETMDIAAAHGGKVTAISGHSQAGPAAAKVGANHHIGKIVNFQPWGGKGAVDSGYFSKEELKHLNKHCHVYTDTGKNIVMGDGNGGEIGYGKRIAAEGSSHKVGFFHIKGNGPDVNWYVKHHQFCSGMTKEQAKKVAMVLLRRSARSKLSQPRQLHWVSSISSITS